MSGLDDKVEHASEVENASGRDVETGSGGVDKGQPGVSGVAGKARTRGPEPPAFIVNLTAEERAALERRLTRKIDFRLMPAILLMYILNYIDRYVVLGLPLAVTRTKREC